MEVYIEYVIIDNMIINYLLLWSTVRILSMKPNKFMVFVSSLFGTIVACLLPLTPFDGIILGLIKIVVAVLMVLISHRSNDIKHFVYALIIFISLTFLTGGACYAIIILLGGTFENITLGTYDTIVPVSIVIAMGFVYATLILKLTKYIYRKRDMYPFMGEAEIEIGGNVYKFKTFLDSGNGLYDKKTGAPVIILSAFALEKFVSNDDMAKLIFGEANKTFHDVHFLEYSTVEGKTKKMVVFSPKRIVIHSNDQTKEYENVCVGVTFKKFKDAINFDCLLHPSRV